MPTLLQMLFGSLIVFWATTPVILAIFLAGGVERAAIRAVIAGVVNVFGYCLMVFLLWVVRELAGG